MSEVLDSFPLGNPALPRCSSKSMYWSCKHNDLEKLISILSQGISPNLRTKEYGNQAGLHVAASFGNLAAVHMLVGKIMKLYYYILTNC